MTPQTRRNILRYGIAIDLVILATGAGMLFEPPPAALLIGAFAVAVILSSWRGGWRAAAAALALSIASLLFVFPSVLAPSQFMLLTGVATIGTTLLLISQRKDTAPVREHGTPSPQIRDDSMASPLPHLALVSPLAERRLRERPAAAEEDKPPAASVVHAKETQKQKKKGRAPAVGAAQREAQAEGERERDRESQHLAEEQRAAAAQAQLREREEAEAKRREADEARAAEEARARAKAEKAKAEEEAKARLEEESRRAAALAAQLEKERRAAEAERARVMAETKAQAEEEAKRLLEAEQARAAKELEAAQARAAKELEEQLARERVEAEGRLAERIEAEKRAAVEAAEQKLEEERKAMQQREEALQAELAKTRKAAEGASTPVASAPQPRRSPQRTGMSAIVHAVTSWFRVGKRAIDPDVKPNRVPLNGNASATRKPPPRADRKPRLLMIEKRRATADTALPKLRQRAIEVVVVERWVDAVDELFRFRPNALAVDIEHPEFDQIHRTISDKASQLPIILTGRTPLSHGTTARHAAFVVRPYDVDELARLTHEAHARPEVLLAQQSRSATRTSSTPPSRRARPARTAPGASSVPPAATRPRAVAPAPETAGSTTSTESSSYEIACYSCRVPFEAVDADWCSCLAKERTLVCSNCLACFCKAPPSYKEKFWVEAPPRLFERKTAEARKSTTALPENPAKESVERPLVLTVEDDEEIQAIVQRVCSNLGYGFIWATNGQDGLDLARAYRPEMILSDAFMPKLDGREMCRLLKEGNELPDCRMVVMTGLYTDTKYRSEAVKRFHVDDYVAKPVAVTELINILQKHLEGVAGLPMQEDLHEVHRAQLEQQVHEQEDGHYEEQFDEQDANENDIPLADIISMPLRRDGPGRAAGYEVCCFNCEQTFDATQAEWCRCVGRDNTLVCPHCSGCFCKAPAAYRERFWIDAPSSLFERKMIGSKRHITIRDNPSAAEVKRPMILLVEDDENVQLIVRTVVSSMGYGFVVGANGQEGLTLAREYAPDLILSDAFMPKLDGREMCRLLKEDPMTSASKAIIMTGLYTDRKYRNEALDYFKVDDYVAKPLAVDDLIRLFKKHLPHEVAHAN